MNRAERSIEFLPSHSQAGTSSVMKMTGAQQQGHVGFLLLIFGHKLFIVSAKVQSVPIFDF